MKKLLTLLLAVCLACSFTACKKEEEVEEQTVVIWSTYTKAQLEYLEQAIADFNAANEGKIKVVHEAQAYSGYDDKVYQAVMAGNGPDIIIDYASTASKFIADGKVADLGAYLPKEYIEALTPQAYAEATSFSDGKMHVYPITLSGPILFYNPEILAEYGCEVPKTWTEVAEVSKKIYEGSGHKIYGFAIDSTTDVAQSMIMQLGVTIFDVEKNEATFNTPEVVEAMAWYGKGCTEGYFLSNPTIDNYFSSDYNAGTLAMYVGSCAGAPYLNAGWGCDVMPKTEGGVDWVPAWNRGILVFASNAAKEAAACKFLEYFASAEINAGWCKACVYATNVTWTEDIEAYKEFTAENPAYGSLEPEIAGSFEAITASSFTRKALQNLMSAVAAGEDPATAVAEAVQYVADELAME